MAPSTAGSTARPSPRTIPQIPHIASGPSGDVAGRAARDHEPGGLGDDLEVEAHAAVGDVLEVVGELLGPGHAPRQPQLREAGDARAHDQPLPVAGDVARQLLEEERPDRARADDAHLAAQHVPELRQLVKLGGAQDAPDARLLVRRHARQLDAGVATDARLRLRLQRAELEHGEDDAAAADAGAAVEDAAAAG